MFELKGVKQFSLDCKQQFQCVFDVSVAHRHGRGRRKGYVHRLGGHLPTRKTACCGRSVSLSLYIYIQPFTVTSLHIEPCACEGLGPTSLLCAGFVRVQQVFNSHEELVVFHFVWNLVYTTFSPFCAACYTVYIFLFIIYTDC